MPRGRKCKYPGGTAIRSFSMPKELAALIDEMPNSSDWVVSTLMGAASGVARDSIEFRKKQARSQVLLYEGAALKAKADLMALEEQGESIARAEQNYTAARLHFLESAKKVGNLRPWLESRVDILSDCGFRSTDEAMEYYKEKKVIR